MSRQLAIFTLQCGDGFTNLMTPTSANLLPCLLMGGVTLKRWYHFILPCYAFVFVVICAAILIGTAIGFILALTAAHNGKRKEDDDETETDAG